MTPQITPRDSKVEPTTATHYSHTLPTCPGMTPLNAIYSFVAEQVRAGRNPQECESGAFAIGEQMMKDGRRIYRG